MFSFYSSSGVCVSASADSVPFDIGRMLHLRSLFPVNNTLFVFVLLLFFLYFMQVCACVSVFVYQSFDYI